VAIETLFYDGDCGLCHRTVRFVAAVDERGAAFRFAPLGGEAFEAAVPVELRGDLPDSIVIHTEDGRLLLRSDATVHMLRRLGGGWRALGAILGAVPRPLRDAAYDAVARIRHRLFRRPTSSCPVVPPELRARFDV